MNKFPKIKIVLKLHISDTLDSNTTADKQIPPPTKKKKPLKAIYTQRCYLVNNTEFSTDRGNMCSFPLID